MGPLEKQEKKRIKIKTWNSLIFEREKKPWVVSRGLAKRMRSAQQSEKENQIPKM
jgi:hypothetical protein